MNSGYSRRARRSLDDASDQVRKAFFKQVKFLEQTLPHPSLRAKKYDEEAGLWQARVN